MANGQPLADAPAGTSHEILERLGERRELKLLFGAMTWLSFPVCVW